MYKPAIRRFTSSDNNQFLDCLTQSINPALFVEILEATISFIKSPNRTEQTPSIKLEIYFTYPQPFLRTLRDELTFNRTFSQNISVNLFTNPQFILPNPLGIQARVSNLLSDETLDIVIIYKEEIQKTVDDLAAQYL